jgi:predicted enzyme related to lactoylglutathione lyase
MSESTVGRFVWYELLTTDTKAAMAFYGEVVGWKTEAWEGGHYTMWVGSQGALGGTISLPEPAKKMGAPPHWMAHVEVADVDETVARVRELGGSVHVEPQDIPKIGRFAVIADPQGASLSVFKPGGGMKMHDRKKTHEFCWHELFTTDQNAALAFYKEIFGWEKLADHDMGPMGTYLIYGRDGVWLGGIMNKPKEMQMPPSFMYYVQVDDVDAALARAKKMGAKVLNGPMEVPGGARVVQLLDPQGAAISLHQEPAPKAG